MDVDWVGITFIVAVLVWCLARLIINHREKMAGKTEEDYDPW